MNILTNVKVGAKNENGDLANPMSKQVQRTRKVIISHLAGIAFGKWPGFNLKDIDAHLEIRMDLLDNLDTKFDFKKHDIMCFLFRCYIF